MNETDLRIAAWKLAAASQDRTTAALGGADLGIAGLTRGLDPEGIDRTSPAYIFGGAEALAAVVAALRRYLPRPEAIGVIERPPRGRIVTAIATYPGLTQSELATRLDILPGNLSGYLRELRDTGFIEPAAPATGVGKAWALTPWATERFLDLLAGPLRGLPERERERASRRLLGLPVPPAPTGSESPAVREGHERIVVDERSFPEGGWAPLQPALAVLQGYAVPIELIREINEVGVA